MGNTGHLTGARSEPLGYGRGVLLPHQIARLEEARLARALSELADEHLSIGGGVAAYGGPDSWLNLVVGVGMDGPISAADADRLVAFYEARGVGPKVEVCPFADPSLARELGPHGFVLAKFESVLCRELDHAPPATMPEGVSFELIDPNDEAMVAQFVDVHVACFATGEDGGRADAMAEGARRMIRHPRTTAWLVRVHGDVAGGGALEVLGPLGTLIAGCVAEPYRRRGIQRALIDHRCAVARDLGCSAVTIGSAPMSATGRNALRAGFVTMYTKAILARIGS